MPERPRIVVFAHIPPPTHGQSLMVERLLGVLHEKGSENFECIHVNARLSDTGADVGNIRVGKFFALIRHVFSALRAWRKGAILYYVPAPVKRSALLRDWIALGVLRLFYRNVVFHWHAVGLGNWVTASEGGIRAQLSRRITKLTHGGVKMSWSLAETNRADGKHLHPQAIRILPNGIPDPVAGFESVLAAREQRLHVRSSEESCEVNLLFCSLCSREKGVFHALTVADQLAKNHPEWRVKLTIAGGFPNDETKVAFEKQITETSLVEVKLAGFLDEAGLREPFKNTDALVFPTQYPAEAQPLVAMESLAWGLPVAATMR